MAMDVQVSGSGLSFPLWKPVQRHYGPDAPFFEAVYIERELLSKQVALDLTDEEKQQIRSIGVWGSSEVRYPIAGCGASLKSLEDFEDHYNARHIASCSVCSRVYPTSRLLSIHVSEVHDSFFQAKVARGYPVYECLVQGCDVKLKSYKSRQQHLVDKHKFPSSFEFFMKTKPSKKHRQKTHHKQAALHQKEDSSSAMQVEEENIDNLVSVVSRLNTSDSPSSISFGRRHTLGLAFDPRAIQKEKNQKEGTKFFRIRHC